MAARRGKSQARRSGRSARRGIPGWAWLLAGLLIGLAIAGFVVMRGGLGDTSLFPRPNPDATAPAPSTDEPVAQQPKPVSKPKYDFYTLLPEKEVVIPEAEISEQARAPEPAPPADDQRYLLQAAAFRNKADAEALKAKLAFSGLVARIESESINGTTWHRVRLGPYADLRQLDAARRQLKGQGVDAIAIKAPKG
ncbi:MAG: SPOR domain-containing protein [Xanthomonadales bacterium]|nr:SPOR domain-containing protein [Xanthomonadales bacterium]